MTEHDQKNDNFNKIQKGKKKLLEIYVIACGLIIASIQSTGSLLAINTSANAIDYNNIISATKTLISNSNLAFFLFLFVILVYYTGMFDESVEFIALFTTLISIFFSLILINFVSLYMPLSNEAYFGLFTLIFIAIQLCLVHNSILMEKIGDKFPKKLKKTALNNELVLNIWKSAVFGVSIYLFYNILLLIISTRSGLLYKTLTSPHACAFTMLWTITAAVLFFILTFL